MLLFVLVFVIGPSYCEWKVPDTAPCGDQPCNVAVGATTTESYSTPSTSEDYDDDDEPIGCGTVSNIQYFLSNGKKAKMMELPWQAGVYSKLFRPYKQICGGTLVSLNVVISAAHCFWEGDHQLPTENYAVTVGKIYRPWYDRKDVHAQKSDVREIHIPPRFLGMETRLQEDLALLVLTTPVTYNNAVRPVCLDFDYGFDKQQLTGGALGLVAGWGLTSENGCPSPTLQTAKLPYIDIKECISNTSASSRTYITCDKFCAGYTNGTALCRGDSGGGLSFPVMTETGPCYYLRGVVSVSPNLSNNDCNVYHWVTFTHLQRHQHYIQEIMKGAEVLIPDSKSTTQLPG